MNSPPDNSLPPADIPTRRWGWQNTPGWVSGLALALVVLCVILRTGFATRDSGSVDETDSIEKTFRAVQITKTAYALGRMPTYVQAYGKTKSATSPEHFADDALDTWRKITRLPFVHTADWRRLALTLSLFHRPGVQEALSHIAAARAVDAARLAKEKSRTARSRKAQAAEVPVAEEVALWKALYGSRPIAAEHVASLRTVIGRLNLGWFEHAALAQLYTQASQKPQAAAELEAAYQSASLIVGYSSFEVGLLALGGLGLLTCGLLFVLHRTSPTERIAAERAANYPPANIYVPPTPAPAYSTSYSPLIPIVPPLPSLVVPESVAPAPLHFSYRARTIAFSVYMAVFMLIGLPLRLLRPLFESWSSGALTRLNTVLEILVYIPVVLIAVWVLRRLAAAESPDRAIPTWRETFKALGMTSQRPLADIGVGTMNYVLLMPVFFAVTALSNKIFQHYHTPINPVQFDSMMAQSNVDRLLLLLVTAVAAPIVEEMMFRGLLYPALKGSWGKIGGAAFSGAIFAIVHPTIPGGFLPIMLLGVAFALTYERRGSLLPNIVMHGIHNGLILLTVFCLFAR
jgi:membrane protease YdiL (CAAX protease family)